MFYEMTKANKGLQGLQQTYHDDPSSLATLEMISKKMQNLIEEVDVFLKPHTTTQQT